MRTVPSHINMFNVKFDLILQMCLFALSICVQPCLCRFDLNDYACWPHFSYLDTHTHTFANKHDFT